MVQPHDVPNDDDREFFVTAWCWHPRFIQHEQIIFISELSLQGACEAMKVGALGPPAPCPAVSGGLPGLDYIATIPS